jgi:hypothetical protein
MYAFSRLSACINLYSDTAEYVACRTCKSPDTLLKKENRLYFLCCNACGSTRSVAPIKKGFEAQVGKRKKEEVSKVDAPSQSSAVKPRHHLLIGYLLEINIYPPPFPLQSLSIVKIPRSLVISFVRK